MSIPSFDGLIFVVFATGMVGIVFGLCWRLACSIGAVTGWLISVPFFLSAGFRIAAVSAGATADAVFVGVLLVAPLTGWNPVVLCAAVPLLAAAGLAALAVIAVQSNPDHRKVSSTSGSD